ncbi:MAG: nuclear transport factor 2 family protein [Bacteroidota bacterium]
MQRTVSVLLLLLIVTSVHSQKLTGNEKDIKVILKNINSFSSYVMAGDYNNIGLSYTEDAKIFPQRRDIIEGRKAIIDYWTLPSGVKTSYHKIFPEEIKVTGDEAYDYGCYEGTTKRANGSESSWKGKYVIVWKKINGDWKIYLDMWSSLK